ncbi:MAG: oxidoreductase [Oscillatoriales cyanobacterium]|uniref:2Fe-2S iron-sulfur cluster-binding protein n=1 Tax=unclassified Microcoleus TaxID=2642155 RepID=UPI001D3A7B73|nr:MULTISPECIES: 2Fe-2S iron-sulfur cluster-binding protein [unclassified Microcoleus]TAE12425.1 MAG: oxidoreductase [Oscillatoriales cyanobacterium]TAE93338.1 MAG: oxidoreductase [Verrucomicrobiota bacterium]MCC3437385.1 2Fe-2S iron-sulfur cluster binding domain-containing protein [Microcoleus sp. PH2017_05_CCC_O_A]MCC3491158.1 2Fe-2S iron-sulfur cluster binding domain-containing protein [Microcoleus sp. PH2017_16_JOR_D_A]TAE24557.1 MAG: oxidoreductase [Oscillatoriales cyanobacterium]
MLENIQQISNPIIRSIAAGIFLGSLVTIPAGLALELLKSPKQTTPESASKLVVYTSLASSVIGAAIGLSSGKRNKDNEVESNDLGDRESLNSGWHDWRKFIVMRKVSESDNITSFYLHPEDNEPIPAFMPGQFLTIKLDLPERAEPVIRTYSLSDYHQSPLYYRLSIKREIAPVGTDLPPGIASNFMHDRIQEDSIIWVKPPAGKFVLNLHHPQPAILISNGVGITPMISMAKAAMQLNPLRHIWFLHGARDSQNHAFRDEINALAASHSNLHIIYCYSQPMATDIGHYHQRGYVDAALIQNIVAPEMQQLCGSTEADYFLCGSASFMDAIRNGLRTWGVADERVMFESFAKAMPKPAKAGESVTTATSDTKEIVFSKSGRTHTWNPADGTILEFAEANGLRPEYSCRAGICGTCTCKIAEGEVEYQEQPSATVERGSVLICISHPKTARVVLDL